LRGVISGCLRRVGVEDAEVHLVLTSDDTIRDLNQRFRDIDRETDVLSFPDGDELPTGELLLGEVVISLDSARRQGEALGHGEIHELCELALHGTLHLLGYDHERDQGEMNEFELKLRRELLS
jgi:probable rRNA maturation factor